MDFRNQIIEDIRFYQEAYPNVANIEKDDWAFNFWVLDKLYGEDENEIENKITDYSDDGVDCYVWHEETKDLYLIQNKFYDPQASSEFDATYFNKAVESGYGQLSNGTYRRSSELQAIFNRYRSDADFYVYHCFYVTNDKKSDKVMDAVRSFNARYYDKHRTATVYYLSDIQEAYYGEPIVEKKTLSVDLYTLNGGTSLKVNNEAYKLNLPIDAIYIMLPVVTLYEALLKAERESYPIFDSNIREYLGTSKSVNKGICKTLESVEDRKRFFFYNNGITIICDEAKTETRPKGAYAYRVKLKNPQIVNGCQTVSSVKHVLGSMPQASLEDEFKDTFVMAKILQIPVGSDGDSEMEDLRKSIVRYNNAQNSIDEKTFAATDNVFRSIQRDFAKYGFLLLLKQSDKEKFKQQYKRPTDLIDRAGKKIDQFGIREQLTKTSDFFVPLDKLLQVVLAFAGDSQQAFQKKGNLLKPSSAQYKLVTEALRSPALTTQTLLNLYLLYLKAEKSKKDDKKFPVTWHLFESFSKIECSGGNYALVDPCLSTPEAIGELVSLYTKVTKSYYKRYTKQNEGKDYNAMIKEKLDIDTIRGDRDIFLD